MQSPPPATRFPLSLPRRTPGLRGGLFNKGLSKQACVLVPHQQEEGKAIPSEQGSEARGHSWWPPAGEWEGRTQKSRAFPLQFAPNCSFFFNEPLLQEKGGFLLRWLFLRARTPSAWRRSSAALKPPRAAAARNSGGRWRTDD